MLHVPWVSVSPNHFLIWVCVSFQPIFNVQHVANSRFFFKLRHSALGYKRTSGQQEKESLAKQRAYEDNFELTSLVQFSRSVVSNSLWSQWTAAHQASLSITNSQSLLKLMPIESVMPSNRLTLCHPILLPPSIFPSIRVFSSESVLWIRWPKYWSFSFSIRASNVYSGLISFRMDWLDLLAVQGTLKNLLQHHSSKASILNAQLSL